MLLFLITYTAAVTSRVNLHGTIPSADCLRNTALHSLRTADPFLVVASLPPEKKLFFRGREATTGNASVATSRNHVATMLLCCSIVLKIVVATCPLYHHLQLVC